MTFCRSPEVSDLQAVHDAVHDPVVLLGKSPPHIGPAAQQDHIVNRHLRTGDILRHKGHPAGDLPSRHPQQITSVHQDPSAVRRQNAVEALEQGTFAHAVVPQDGHELPLFYDKPHVIQYHWSTFIVIADIFNLQHGFPFPL